MAVASYADLVPSAQALQVSQALPFKNDLLSEANTATFSTKARPRLGAMPGVQPAGLLEPHSPLGLTGMQSSPYEQVEDLS